MVDNMKNILLIIITIIAGGFGFMAYSQAQKNMLLEQELSSVKQNAVANTSSSDDIDKLKTEIKKQNQKIRSLEYEVNRKKAFIERLEKSYEKLINQKTTITDDMGSEFRTKNLPPPEPKRVVTIPRSRPVEENTEGTHVCKAGESYFYSSKPCSSAENVQKINMTVNQVGWNPIEPEPEEKESKSRNRPERLSEYQTIKKRLSKQCEGISDSRQQLACRKNAKRTFTQNCRNESLSKYTRRANCSLADSYRVVD